MKTNPSCPGCICCEFGSSPRSADEKKSAEKLVSPTPKHKGIVCPQCNGEGPFRLIEDICCWRPIYGMTTDGDLVAGGFYHTEEGYGDGNDMRIECHSYYVDERGIKVFCGHSFALPNDVYNRIEWV